MKAEKLRGEGLGTSYDVPVIIVAAGGLECKPRTLFTICISLLAYSHRWQFYY